MLNCQRFCRAADGLFLKRRLFAKLSGHARPVPQKLHRGRQLLPRGFCANPEKTILRLSLVSPLGLFTKKHESETVALENIPKEVFKKDMFKKPKRKVFGRMFYLVLYNLKLGWKFVCLSCTFFPILLMYPVACLSLATKKAWWKLLLFACEHSGPTFIKLGQWAGTRRDLFDKEFCAIFSKLHDQTQEHSWYYTKQKLKKAFGKNWRKIFAKIERKPVGSGCVAQVHRAYMHVSMVPDEHIIEEMTPDLDDEEEIDFAQGVEITGFSRAIDAVDKDEGYPEPDIPNDHSNTTSTENRECSPEVIPEAAIPVAVKVLHPGMYSSVKSDLKVMHFMARLLETFVPSTRWLSLTECLREFGGMMMKQIDLRFEADCLERFVENFEHVPNVRFPRPVRPFCKRDVMVETWEGGEPIRNYVESVDTSQGGKDGTKEALAAIGIDALLKMVFVDNFVHGDLHPGNILVQNAEHFSDVEENKMLLVDAGDTAFVSVKPVETSLRLVLLDTGISVSLSAADLANLKAVFTAVVLGQGETVAELMLHHATYNECKDVPSFVTELGGLVSSFRKSAISLHNVEVGSLLSQVFTVLTKHRVKMESNFATVILALFVLEGLGRSLDPNVDILEKARPVLLHGALS